MTPLKEIGEILISDENHDYFFRPSFANMARIGSPREIVERFVELHSNEVIEILDRATQTFGLIPDWLAGIVLAPAFSSKTISAAMDVMQACCEEDISLLIGELHPSRRGKKTFTYRAGLMPINDIIIVACSLINHGIIGKAKVRRLQRHENNSYVNEFSSFEYISSARNHFNMSREEAERLTMTEFQLLLNNKYPDQNGFTREEYDAISDDYFAKKKARLNKASV